MNQKSEKEKNNKSNQSLNEYDQKDKLCLSMNSSIEKDKDIIKNIQKRPKTFENKKKLYNNEYKIGGYLIKNNLGEGTFGKVKLGIYLKSGEKVAIKIISKKKLKEKNDQIHLKREIDLLQKLNHINIISVYEIFENIDNYYIVMEYCSKGELFNYIVSKRRLNEAEAAYFFYQLINGLEYIHSIGISHRDIKPENLLLTGNYILKIIDFGLSNYYNDNINKYLATPCGSPCYSSPEMVSGKSYNGFKVDVWSCGIVLFAMLCGYLPFDDKTDDKIIFKKIVECEIKYPFFLSDMARDIIAKLLIKDPNKRISIKEVKMHPFYIKGKKKFELDFGIINKAKLLKTLTERTFFKSNNNKKKEIEKNENKENMRKYIRDEIEVAKHLSNYSIDENNNENEINKYIYIPLETDVQEYRKNEDLNKKINKYKRDIKSDHRIMKNKNNDKKHLEKKSKNNSSHKEKKIENKSKEKVNINKLLRKNIISILFNTKKINKKNTINDKINPFNVTNNKSSINNNQKLSNIIKSNRSNNNIYYMSSAENLFKKPHSKAKEKVSKLTKKFDINILNIEHLNTDINEIDERNNIINTKEYLKNFINKPNSSNKEECKNNSRKNYLLIETNFNNINDIKHDNCKYNKNSNINTNYLIKDDSINTDNATKNISNKKNKIIKKEESINNKISNKINNRKVNKINKYFNISTKENDMNINNNLATFSQSSNKVINNIKDINKKVRNENYKRKYRINNTLSNLNENLYSNDLNAFNQKSKSKKNHNINNKNSKENNLIDIIKIKKSISKKNKLIGLTKKKSFFTIRDTVINFDTGNGKIIILPPLNKSKEKIKESKKEKEILKKKCKSQQGIQKSSTNIKIQSNYLIKKMKHEKLSSSLLNNCKLNDLSGNNNISKELSFNKKENMLYNYCNYKEKQTKYSFNKKYEDQKNSGIFFIPQNLQNSQEKNYSKFNRIKIEEYYRHNMNNNYGNNHKFHKINLVNKNIKKHCVTNLYMNNFKIDLTGNFGSHKQKLSNIIKTNINSNNHSKNDFIGHQNCNSNSSNNIVNINDKNIYRYKADNIFNFNSRHKKILNLTHRTENNIQKVIKNIIKKN